MGFLGRQADKAVEAKVYQEAGYPGLIKFKVVRFFRQIQTCSCCG
jgi:hypothetical protein